MTLVRVYAASLVVNLPVLVLLLIPQLIRSRAGSEQLLAVGTVLLLALVTAAVVAAPEVSARLAPSGPWQFGQARGLVRTLIRQRRGEYLWRLAEFVLLYAASQGVGGIIAWIMPYVWSNPDYGVVAGAERWVIDYPHFATQAISIYLVFCLATAWYSCRVRQLAIAHLGR